MDAFAGLLEGPRAREAFLLRSVMDPPWSLRIHDEAPLTLVAIVHGDAWVVPDAGAPTRLAAGDVAIIRGPDPYTVADDPATVPQVVIHPGQVCMTPDGQHLAEAMHLGVRTWGNCADGATTMLTGTYQLHSAVSAAVARRAASARGIAGRSMGLPVRVPARRRDREGRPRAGSGPRPLARPAAHRRAARVVRARRCDRVAVVSRLP